MNLGQFKRLFLIQLRKNREMEWEKNEVYIEKSNCNLVNLTLG